jgi:Methyltransferase domain
MIKNALIKNGARCIYRKAVVFGMLITFWGALHAEWDPRYCLLEPECCTDEPNIINAIEAPGFKSLKADVTKFLENSWCSKEKIHLLMNLILVTRPEVCIEIGAFTGSSVLPVAATLKYLRHGKVYAIDAWSNTMAVRHLDSDDPNRSWWSSVNMKKVHKSFQNMKNQWSLGPYCITVHNSSENAFHQFSDIDFLHIDGDYSEKGSLQDINLYLPKVKSGGYILLSNILLTVKGKQPKETAFFTLFQSCEFICEIEQNNTILFMKN